MKMSTLLRLLSAVAMVNCAVVGVASAQDSSTQADRPVEKALKTMSDGVMKKAPNAARMFDDGIKEVAATGIVDKAPKVGDKAELFELPDATGKIVKLEDLLAKGPVVLTWYRGGWCPYCNIGLRGLVKAEPQIRQLGATLVAITPETPDNSAKTVKTDGLTFVVLSDKGNAVASRYKIAYKLPAQISAGMKAHKVDLAKFNGDDSDVLPLPVTYVVDRDRTIRWAFVNADYRLRAEPADVVEALKKLK